MESGRRGFFEEAVNDAEAVADGSAFAYEISQVYFMLLNSEGKRCSSFVNVGFRRDTPVYSCKKAAALMDQYQAPRRRALRQLNVNDSQIAYLVEYKMLIPAVQQLITQSAATADCKLDPECKLTCYDEIYGKAWDYRVHIWVQAADPPEIVITGRPLFIVE